ncbi:DNA repair protein RecN [Lederbergia galactosidilytica]|uniref:DNA repair protein RecN n=1 Tax=Lederbergia galactosidilytica TaxID=217031 RepID=A0A178A540_9BACI|nr:DNA repair protein RecN [Lederbergia galactosidilytica]OAK75307.1 DNA recombination protein RecN [Lederbergia galactosidilytica]
MLQELSIKNFAIIDEIHVSFEKGLTVLTGETGAGKSIIIDALHLLMGGRGSSEFVRHGEKKAEIEGLFDLTPEHPCYLRSSEFGIEIEDGMLILRREISHNGKSVCRINGKLVTISILREIGSTLVDIHGQHEHQELMDESRHLSLLDQFGGEKIANALMNYREIYTTYVKILKKINDLKLNEQQIAQRLDILQFQAKEIQNADLKLNEDEQLLAERKQLANFEKIYASLKASYEGLQGEKAGLDYIGHAMGHLESAAELDDKYSEAYETTANSYYLLEDISTQIREGLENMEFDPDRLNEIEGRIHEINQLKRKYGGTIEEILEYGAKIEEEMETLTNREARIDELERKLDSIKKDLAVEGKYLSKLRKQIAEILSTSIHRELKGLYMEKAIFKPVFTLDEKPHIEFKKDGIDEVIFYISTNPGEPLKPLSKVASGGELSRIMLALKTIFSKHQGITSIIFDEVDTGVSGRVAQAIAEKIAKISQHSQVLCITHLPQVAAMSDTHFLISKKEEFGRTKTHLTNLQKNQKINEIARMISGAEMTELTREHAKELLEIAGTIKNT